MIIDEKQGGAFSASQEAIEELLCVVDPQELSTQFDIGRLLAQLRDCIYNAGAYAIADAIGALEAYTNSLGLDAERTQELIHLIDAFVASNDLGDVFQVQCELLGAMIRMSLDKQAPNSVVAASLFEMVSTIAEAFHTNPAARQNSHCYSVASEIVRKNLENACTDGDSMVVVQEFALQLQREVNGSREMPGTAFIRYFVGHCYANF